MLAVDCWLLVEGISFKVSPRLQVLPVRQELSRRKASLRKSLDPWTIASVSGSPRDTFAINWGFFFGVTFWEPFRQCDDYRSSLTVFDRDVLVTWSVPWVVWSCYKPGPE